MFKFPHLTLEDVARNLNAAFNTFIDEITRGEQADIKLVEYHSRMVEEYTAELLRRVSGMNTRRKLLLQLKATYSSSSNH